MAKHVIHLACYSPPSPVLNSSATDAVCDLHLPYSFIHSFIHSFIPFNSGSKACDGHTDRQIGLTILMV